MGLFHGGHGHDHDHDHDHDHEGEAGLGDPTLPIVAIFVILVLSLAGSLLPPLVARYFPKFDLNSRWTFRFFNGFAAGIVLGIAYVHSIPDAFGSFQAGLADNDNPAASYSWAGFIAMIGSLITFASEEVVHRYVGRFASIHGHAHTHDHGTQAVPVKEVKEMDNGEEGKPKDLESQDSHDHEHEPTASDYYSELYVLLFGLSFHSLFIGIALGVVTDDWGLFAAMLFHQFFEGMALGARVARANFRNKLHIWLLDIVFSLAAPIGIAIGLGIRSTIAGDPVTYAITNGVFQALSGGILIYVALIHMMKEEMERPEFKKGGPLLYCMYAGFALGTGTMAVIGIWA